MPWGCFCSSVSEIPWLHWWVLSSVFSLKRFSETTYPSNLTVFCANFHFFSCVKRRCVWQLGQTDDALLWRVLPTFCWRCVPLTTHRELAVVILFTSGLGRPALGSFSRAISSLRQIRCFPNRSYLLSSSDGLFFLRWLSLSWSSPWECPSANLLQVAWITQDLQSNPLWW